MVLISPVQGMGTPVDPRAGFLSKSCGVGAGLVFISTGGPICMSSCYIGALGLDFDIKYSVPECDISKGACMLNNSPHMGLCTSH